jgi:hypothetical protein
MKYGLQLPEELPRKVVNMLMPRKVVNMLMPEEAATRTSALPATSSVQPCAAAAAAPQSCQHADAGGGSHTSALPATSCTAMR